jgi:hypothetical protein
VGVDSIGVEGIGEVGGEVRIVDDRAVLSCARDSKWNLKSSQLCRLNAKLT